MLQPMEPHCSRTSMIHRSEMTPEYYNFTEADLSKAVDAQTVCPGYLASNVKTSGTGLTADLALAGPACNVYGSDVDSLSLLVEYQTESRLHVSIAPKTLTAANESFYILPT